MPRGDKQKHFDTEDALILGFAGGCIALFIIKDFRDAINSIPNLVSNQVLANLLRFIFSNVWWTFVIILFIIALLRLYAHLIESVELRFYSIDFFWVAIQVLLMVFFIPLSALSVYFLFAFFGYVWDFNNDITPQNIGIIFLFIILWYLLSLLSIFILYKPELKYCQTSKYKMYYVNGRIRRLLPYLARYMTIIFITILVLFIFGIISIAQSNKIFTITFLSVTFFIILLHFLDKFLNDSKYFKNLMNKDKQITRCFWQRLEIGFEKSVEMKKK